MSNRCKGLRVQPSATKRALGILDKENAFPLPPGDLSIVFLDDQWMSDLHATYLSDPSPTDVITFPGTPEVGEAGEICIGTEQAWALSQKGYEPFSRELMLYIIHGWLHLWGLNDQTDEQRKEMRSAEAKAFSLIEREMPIPASSFSPPAGNATFDRIRAFHL